MLLEQIPEMWKWLWNWAVVRGWKNSENHDRKTIDCLEQAVSRNMDVGDSASEDSGVRNMVEKI